MSNKIDRQIDISHDDIVALCGFAPQATFALWCSWDWFINDSHIVITGIRRSPDEAYKFHYYGPEWVFEALFLETDESLLSRYE